MKDYYFFLFRFGLLVLTITHMIGIQSCKKDSASYETIQTQNIKNVTFIGSENCKTCHINEYRKWDKSHHEQAMKEANDSTILGDFHNKTFTYKGTKSLFTKKGKDYYVNTIGNDGKYRDFKINYTFGFYPLQQYITEIGNGKYQCLTTAWNDEDKKWFNLSPDIDINHKDWLHWTGGGMNWNNMCSDCHSTDVYKNYSSNTDSYNTSFAEINVACEACHGPGSNHAKYYKKNKDRQDKHDMYMTNDMSSKMQIDKCARCHSRRSQLTSHYDFSETFLDHYAPSLLTSDSYEIDGQIQDEDYVYGSFLQSKMYANGVSCKDCHDVHSLKLKEQGNALCLKCHEPKYDSPSHHFHTNGTNASKCINCHMTGKYYMGIDFRRDHSFRVPRPDQSQKYGTPNACNGCHQNKTAKWASDFIVKNYGKNRPEHFSDELLEAYNEAPTLFDDIVKNSKTPDIIRATALNQMGTKTLNKDIINSIRTYLQDSSALVRNEAVTALSNTNSQEFGTDITPLLQDKTRLVRISAARYFHMSGHNIQNIPNSSTANDEYHQNLKANADFASGQHQYGLYYMAMGDTTKALQSYEKALNIDRHFNTSRMNLALLYYQLGRTKDAEKEYLVVTQQEPKLSYPYYMLGLLYNESNNHKNALKYLALATQKVPANQNAFYNYALKLQENKNYSKSINILSKGLEIFPNSERLLYVKMLAEININDENAVKSCKQLILLNPNNNKYKEILKSLNH